MDQQVNLRVRMLGALAVAVDGREVPPHELASRLDPPATEGLLQLARSYGSSKYLALARLGRRPEAAPGVASGSDCLLAQVAPPVQARAAADRIATALPAELRPAFQRHGYLASVVPGT